MTPEDNDTSNTNVDEQATDERTGDTDAVSSPEHADDRAIPRTGGSATRRRFLGTVAAVATGAAVGGVASGRQQGALSGLPDWSRMVDRSGNSFLQGGASFDAGVTDPLDSETLQDAGTLAPPETLGEVWRQEFQGEDVNTPFFAGTSSDRMYVVGNKTLQNTIYALDKNDGSVAWNHTVNGPFPGLGFEEGRAVYYTNQQTAEVVALDKDDGSELWRSSYTGGGGSFGAALPAPFHVSDDSTVYVLAGSSVEAFDDQDGTRQWGVTVSGTLSPILNSLYDDGGSSLFYVFSFSAQSSDGTVTAIDRAAGTDVWSETRSGGSGWIANTDDTVFVSFTGQSETELVAFDAASGSVQWTEGRQDDLLWSLSFSFSDSSLYAFASRNEDNQSSEGEIVKFDTDGTRIWEYDAGSQVRGLAKQTDNAFICTADGRVESLVDAPANQGGGTVEWSEDLGAEITDAGIQRSGDVLYTGTIAEPGTVYALSTTDGTILDTFGFSSGVTGGLAVFDERIWVANPPAGFQTGDDSAMYELGEGDGGGNWYDSYTDDNGVVDTSGFRTGIDDWQTVDISTSQLSTLLDSWQNDSPIDL